ncbi:MAG TPA: FliM/FliN family flagellar motor switch protein [Oscillatoriaceae cyanobacterium]
MQFDSGYEPDEAVITQADDSFGLELRAIYALHSLLGEHLAQLQDEYVTFPQTLWQVTSVEITPFRTLDERYAENAVWGILDFVDQPGGAFMFLDMPAAELLTGISAEDLSTDDGMPYVEAYLNHVGELFMACWQEIAQFDVQMFPSPMAPSLMDLQSMFPGLNQNTPIISTAFRVVQPGQAATARVVLAIPQAYLLAVGAGLRAVGEQTFANTDTSNFHERLAYMEDLPVPVSVMLGRAEMTVGDLQNLEEGDVIELDTTLGFPLDVTVGNKHVLGKPGTSADGRRLAIQIVQLET